MLYLDYIPNHANENISVHNANDNQVDIAFFLLTQSFQGLDLVDTLEVECVVSVK